MRGATSGVWAAFAVGLGLTAALTVTRPTHPVLALSGPVNISAPLATLSAPEEIATLRAAVATLKADGERMAATATAGAVARATTEADRVSAYKRASACAEWATGARILAQRAADAAKGVGP